MTYTTSQKRFARQTLALVRGFITRRAKLAGLAVVAAYRRDAARGCDWFTHLQRLNAAEASLDAAGIEVPMNATDAEVIAMAAEHEVETMLKASVAGIQEGKVA